MRESSSKAWRARYGTRAASSLRLLIRGLDDFNAGQLPRVGAATQGIDRIARAEPNDRDLLGARVQQHGEHSNLRMDRTIGQPALSDAVAKDPDGISLEAVWIAFEDRQSRCALAGDDRARLGAMEFRPELV